MAGKIRFKKSSSCDYWGSTSSGGGECLHESEERVPMRDWEVSPKIINPPTILNDVAPQNYFINVVFPELNLWEERKYDNFKYKIRITYANSSIEWLGITSTELSETDFSEENISKATINLYFRNIGQLSERGYTANVIIEAYGIDTSGTPHFVEKEDAQINIKIKSNKDNPNRVYLDKKVLNLVFNKSTKKLTGDTSMIAYNIISDVVSITHLPFGMKANCDTARDLPVRTIINYSITDLNKDVGKYEEVLFVNLDGINSKEIVHVNLVVVDNETPILPDFHLEKDSMSLVLSKPNKEVKENAINISNPQNLKLNVIIKPLFIDTAVIVNNQLLFKTKESLSLALGNYSGDIVVESHGVIRKIKIYLRVVENIHSGFKDNEFYFALDGNKLEITKTNPVASYVIIRMEMLFDGFKKISRETQEYSFPFYEDKIIFDPGREVQDFFFKIKDFGGLENQKELFKLAPVNISVKEFDSDDTLLKESQLRYIYFAPGKKPKCYPFLTNTALRRTFPNSLISLNCISTPKDLSNVFKDYKETMKNISEKSAGFHLFKRESFYTPIKEKMEFGGLKFIPFPSPDNVIHLFFENQNLVLDWMTLTGNFKKKFSFNHITNIIGDEKYLTTETENIIINTGWIFREEIELINEIIKSRVCFLVINGEIIKAHAIDKKNEIYDTTETKYSFDLEFNIKTDER